MTQEEIASIFIQTMQAHAEPRDYDWSIFLVAIAGVIASLAVAYFAFQLNKKQIAIAITQSEISKEQTAIAKKQSEIMEQQNNIALLKYRLNVYVVINKVLACIEDNDKETFLMNILKLRNSKDNLNDIYTLKNSFLEEAYNARIVFDDEFSETLIEISQKFGKFFEYALELSHTFQKLIDEGATAAKTISKNLSKIKDLRSDEFPQEILNIAEKYNIYTLIAEIREALTNDSFKNKLKQYMSIDC